MLKDVASLCLAPVLLAGVLFSTDVHFSTPSKNKTELDHAGIVQVMSCETGPGIGIPKLGLSATSQAVKELPQYVQFGLGLQLLMGYDEYRIGLEVWHLSNGSALGLNVSDRPNIGLNLPLLTIGKVF